MVAVPINRGHPIGQDMLLTPNQTNPTQTKPNQLSCLPTYLTCVGQIPVELANLSKIRKLFLSHNQLTGQSVSCEVQVQVQVQIEVQLSVCLSVTLPISSAVNVNTLPVDASTIQRYHSSHPHPHVVEWHTTLRTCVETLLVHYFMPASRRSIDADNTMFRQLSFSLLTGADCHLA